MDDVLFMHVLKSINYLLYDRCCLFFWKFLFLLDVLKTTVRKGLKDEIQFVFIMEIPEERCQVFVVQIRLDLYLPQNVFLDLCFPDSLL